MKKGTDRSILFTERWDLTHNIHAGSCAPTNTGGDTSKAFQRLMWTMCATSLRFRVYGWYGQCLQQLRRRRQEGKVIHCQVVQCTCSEVAAMITRAVLRSGTCLEATAATYISTTHSMSARWSCTRRCWCKAQFQTWSSCIVWTCKEWNIRDTCEGWSTRQWSIDELVRVDLWGIKPQQLEENWMDPTNHLKCFYLKKARRFCIKLLCKDGGDSILRKKAWKCQQPMPLISHTIQAPC